MITCCDEIIAKSHSQTKSEYVYVIAWDRVKLVFNFTRVFKVSQKIAQVAQRRGEFVKL